ncbi:hypothetical protein BZG06_14780 [Salinivibrio kushneri]|uniref:Type I restriction modification DNA specificity domain-containing protein n=1 Tax=Salinivibrio kushneri TaxID=1908198 RepID=A0AB36K3D6_9GAMM|nr:restriction endonuclease subunit S [Salinivibrio kushneri]OOE40873.1 hypothetical protein BZG06_14780 [Salinivibrio kushneri]OOE42354.1 hypothetical protein BZG09_13845 [Salinivibrio kushneri]
MWGSDPEDNEFTYVLRSTDQTVDGYWSIELPAQRYLTAKERQSATLEEGDLVVTKSSGSSKHIGKTTIVSSDMEKVGYCYGNFMQRLRTSTQLCSKYSWYVINSFICRQQLDVLSSTTTGLANLNGSLIGELVLPCPSKIEQQKIAQFLDYETAKIDALIDEQKRLIELLKEKRQAVISHAVTKGLNPDAPMKDSGAEWLGDVPAHWVAGKIKHLAKVISKGTTPSTLGGDFEDKGVRFIKAENVGKSISVSTSPEFFISEEVDELLKRSRLQESDVLVIIAGATTGKASVITDELLPANTNQAVSFIRPTSSIYSKWIALSMGLSSTQNEIQLTSVQSAQPNLSMEDLGNLSILIPPQSEVSDIIRYLEKSTKKIDILMAESERLMKLQVERRSALISAAVTGKIDVRDWQPPEDADLIDSNAAVQMERQDG